MYVYGGQTMILRIILVILLIIAAPFVGIAAIYTASSCSSGDVSSAMALASAGDTVAIPAGTCSWTAQVSWTVPANVTLTGAGTTAIGGGDVTVIQDDFGTNSPLLSLTLPTTGSFRMTGITIEGATGVNKDDGLIRVTGSGGIATARFDHLHIDTQSYSPNINIKAMALNRVYGVIDHSIFDLYNTSAIYVYGDASNSNTNWAAATNFGTNAFIFIEDNQVNGSVAEHATRIVDCFSAGRHIIRFNSFVGSAGAEDHPTGHSSNDRGCRAKEVYGNTFVEGVGQTEPNFNITGVGSGVALVWGNDADANNDGDGELKNGLTFNVTRKNNATYTQTATPNGWGYCGTEFNGVGSNWDQNTTAAKGYACIDQPGRGKGDLLTGVFPNKVNDRTGTIAWPGQVLEPIYTWNNDMPPATGWGGSSYSDSTNGRLTADVDYYQQASGIQTSSSSPFDGTTGTGWGTIANRPTTCTKGVAYFATDQGSWNRSGSNPEGVQQNGADGVLYRCLAANVWTLYYTPYVYPHPLQGGMSTTGGTVTGGCINC